MLVSALGEFDACSVDGVVKLLDTIVSSRRAAPMPLFPTVTLHLATGHSFRGLFAGVYKDNDGTATLRVELMHESEREPSGDTLFVEASRVAAISVHQLKELLNLLVPESTAPPPSGLQLKRQIADLESRLAEVCGHAVSVAASPREAPATVLRNLAHLLDTAAAVLIAIGVDASGRVALSGLSEVRFETGTQLEARCVNSTLTIKSPLDKTPVVPLTFDAVKRVIERAL